MIKVKVPFTMPVIDEEMIKEAGRVLREERLVMGKSVTLFEEEFADYCGTTYAVSTSSGTAALHLALMALNLQPSSPVLTSTLSFIASANAIIHARHTPVFADIHTSSGLIDISTAETNTYKAVIPVHLYGNPVRMQSIWEFAAEHNIPIIEDACQAHGATYRGKKTGSLGTVGCFSFYSTKNMTVGGDGGMVTTNDEKIATLVAKMRDCGRTSRYVHDVLGYTLRLNTINAAIGRIQLQHLDTWNKQRREAAAYYLKHLPTCVVPLQETEESTCVYHLFVVKVERRDQLQETLAREGIETMVHYPLPIHRQPYYEKTYGYTEGRFPRAEEFSKNILSLPLFPGITREQQQMVCDAIGRFYE